MNDPAHAAGHDPTDDPRLTAYALGELDGPAHTADRAEVEALLARDAVAQRFVEETRAFATSLESRLALDGALDGAVEPALHNAVAPALDASQRDAVRTPAVTATGGSSRGARIFRVERWPVPAGLAAALLVGVAFSARHEIGRWWAGGDRDLARVPDANGNVLRYVRTAPDAPRAPSARTRATTDLVDEATQPASEAHLRGPARGTGARNSQVAAATQPSEPTKPPVSAPLAGSPPSNSTYERTEDPSAPRAKRLSAAPSEQKPSGGVVDGTYVPRLADGGPVGGSPGAAGPTATSAPKLPPAGPVRVVYRQDGKVWTPADADPDHLVLFTSRDEPVSVAELEMQLKADRRFLALRGRLVADVASAVRAHGESGAETYRGVSDNPFARPLDAPLSTFGLDVDTASYSNLRRFLVGGRLPPANAVRVEEMVNYFDYGYAPPSDGAPIAVHTEVAGCPWNAEHRLVRVGVKAKVVDMKERPAANLVFLVDVSGSMEPANKLPLLVQSMKQLVPTLGERDKVAIVTYADGAQVALAATRGDRHQEIVAALDALRAGGSTNGGAGIQEAYRIAREGFVAGGVNRVLLATDGDFNVGTTSDDALVRLIQEQAKSNVFLTILGFGEGNLQDAKMEAIADRGNGHYAYVDSLREGRKVLVEQAAATLVTVAKDVKIQVEFNPLRVASYRLIGYENRALAAQDFRDDTKDAGDLGAGHTVTALYEIVPTATLTAGADSLRYVQNVEATDAARSGELLVVKARWKLPEASESTGREFPVTDAGSTYASASADFRFAAAVASFGMLLRGSPHRGNATAEQVIELAGAALGNDGDGRRAEFVDLVRKAREIAGR